MSDEDAVPVKVADGDTFIVCQNCGDATVRTIVYRAGTLDRVIECGKCGEPIHAMWPWVEIEPTHFKFD